MSINFAFNLNKSVKKIVRKMGNIVSKPKSSITDKTQTENDRNVTPWELELTQMKALLENDDEPEAAAIFLDLIKKMR